MNFTLNINMDNAAFDEDAGIELARILRVISSRVIEGATSGTCHDINGNKVGSWEIETA